MSSRNGPNSMDGHSRRPNFSNEVKTVEDGKQTEIRAKKHGVFKHHLFKRASVQDRIIQCTLGTTCYKMTKMKFRKYLLKWHHFRTVLYSADC